MADELVVSRAGRRVRVGNTDAEGRMVMVDLLCEMKEKVIIIVIYASSSSFVHPKPLSCTSIPSHSDHLCLQAIPETSPQLFTIATLTGHAIRAMGPNYSVSTAETQTILPLTER